MRWQLQRILRWPAWLAACCLAAYGARAVTVAGLKEQLAQGGKVTIVDVRSTALFTQGHIPGAINIPAALCSRQHLPPLGNVVVCGAGLGRDSEEDAASAALAAKPGISVDVLEGGFAAWESAQGLTTKARGLKPEAPNYISYAQLKAAKADSVVLVDLRRQSPASPNAVLPPNDALPLTDLSREFPGFQVTQTPVAPKPQVQSAGAGSGPPPLLVLIDNGDGSALQTARTLQAGGYKRCAILAGGERILSRHGQAGLQRSSAGASSTATLPPPRSVK
jgi:rhodanese-related sulfurtransferase